MIYTAHDYLIWDDHSVYPSAFMPPDMPCKERYRRTRNKVMTYIRMYITYHLFFSQNVAAVLRSGFVPVFIPGMPPGDR